MKPTKLPAIAVVAMLVLTAFASVPVAAVEESVAVSTGSAADVTDSSATLAGELTALEGADNASVWFGYWPQGDAANNTTTTAVDLGEPGVFDASVDGLANNTTFVFVAHAATENASDVGEQRTFTTLDRSAPLGVETDEATDVTDGSATLNGVLTGLDGEESATVWFEYWVAGDRANGSATADQPLEAPGSFDETLGGLENDTTYVYVARAEANGSNVTGEAVEFTTGDPAEPTWDGQGPFGQWVTSWLKPLLNGESSGSFGQLVSHLVTLNNPGSEHRSAEANPGGNGNGPPDHAGKPDDVGKNAKHDGERGPPGHANNDEDEPTPTPTPDGGDR